MRRWTWTTMSMSMSMSMHHRRSLLYCGGSSVLCDASVHVLLTWITESSSSQYYVVLVDRFIDFADFCQTALQPSPVGGKERKKVFPPNRKPVNQSLHSALRRQQQKVSHSTQRHVGFKLGGKQEGAKSSSSKQGKQGGREKFFADGAHAAATAALPPIPDIALTFSPPKLLFFSDTCLVGGKVRG